MRGVANDAVRWLIAGFIGLLALVLSARERLALRLYRRRQQVLRRRFGISDRTPILPYGPEIERLVRERAAELGSGTRFALTSGSSAAPKRLLYTPGRLRQTKAVFVDAFVRACRTFRLSRRSLFVLSALSQDESLTAQLLSERGRPSALALLQAPYRVQSDPAIRTLVDEHGATAVRFFLLVVSNPGVLYATNPSTLAAFLDQVAADWEAATALVRRFESRPGSLPRAVHRLVARLASRGWEDRLHSVATAAAALPVERWLPGLQAYLTWTGGYVTPFLRRVREHLPWPRFRLVPMYSMSTEVVETVPSFLDRDEPAFLPVGPGVLYEFLPLRGDDAEPDDPARLLPAAQLQPGRLYTMVVSDGFGLRRYQTGDVFLCRRLVRGLPDLAFVRRRGLEHSFTGEKLTAQQASAAFDRTRNVLGLPEGLHLALVPSWPAGEPVPHYRLVVIGPAPLPAVELATLASRCQSELEEQNSEYRGKVASARLRPLRGTCLSEERFARLVGGARHRGSWEAQFKFLPLYRTRWESSA
jgi:hypothetical protein